MNGATGEIVGPVMALLGAVIACWPMGSVLTQLRDAGTDGDPHACPQGRPRRPPRERFERDPVWLAPVLVPTALVTRPPYRGRGAHRLSGLAVGTTYAPILIERVMRDNAEIKRPGLTRTERRGIEIT